MASNPAKRIIYSTPGRRRAARAAVHSPLAGGYLSGKYRDGNSSGRRLSIPFPPVDEAKGALTALAAVALAWLLHQRAVVSVILGIKRLAQLGENLLATQLILSATDL